MKSRSNENFWLIQKKKLKFLAFPEDICKTNQHLIFRTEKTETQQIN